jgi:hypothetical protein
MNATADTRRIPAANLPRLQAEVETMNKRADRLGVAPLTLTVLNTETKIRRHEITGVEWTEEWVNVTLTGESPVLNGWRLVARKTPVVTGEQGHEKTEYLVQTVPGQQCPQQYRFTGMECDHCGFDRRRNDTFILVHDNGNFAQVGRNCIADFLGHQSPESMLACAEWAFSGSKMLDEASDEHWGCGHGPTIVPIGLFLAVTSVVIRHMGWVSRKEVFESEVSKTATANIAWDVCVRSHDRYVQEMIREFDLKAEERDGKLALEALLWARALPVNAGDYLYNLGVQARRQVVDFKGVGLVASMITAYQRHLEEKTRQQIAQAHTHVGTVGVREGFPTLTIKALNSFPSDFGVCTLVRFEDAQGNTLVWWTGSPPDWVEMDKTVDITATVKGHDDYKGQPQTTLTRCSQGLPKPKKAKKVKASNAQPV